VRKLALFCAAVGAAFTAVMPAAAIAPPARMQVGATEFNFGLSRHTIKAGRALIELANYGEDPHDLRLRRIGGTKIWGTRVVAPEDTAVLSAKLPPGRYRLWCSIADHRAKGMSALLTVRR
jgi:plastocyanin